MKTKEVFMYVVIITIILLAIAIGINSSNNEIYYEVHLTYQDNTTEAVLARWPNQGFSLENGCIWLGGGSKNRCSVKSFEYYKTNIKVKP